VPLSCFCSLIYRSDSFPLVSLRSDSIQFNSIACLLARSLAGAVSGPDEGASLASNLDPDSARIAPPIWPPIWQDECWKFCYYYYFYHRLAVSWRPLWGQGWRFPQTSRSARRSSPRRANNWSLAIVFIVTSLSLSLSGLELNNFHRRSSLRLWFGLRRSQSPNGALSRACVAQGANCRRFRPVKLAAR